MDDLETIQNEILRLAYGYFRNMDFSEGFSCPLIPRISKEYLKNRIVIMGQETNTWWDRIYSNQQLKDWCTEKKCLNDGYDKFVKNEVERYGGSFWNFSRSLYKEVLNEHICLNEALSHCWVNLFCIEKCEYKNDKDKKHKPSQCRELAKRVMGIQKDFIFQIMKLIRPKIILAMIGVDNDDLFQKYVLGTEDVERGELFEKNKIVEYKVCNKLSPLYGTSILRTYHPNFFMNYMSVENREKYKKIIYERIKAFIES